MSKKIKKNNGIFYVAISLFAVFGMATIGFAAGVANTVNVSGDYNYYEAESMVEPGDVTFGAFSGPDIYQDLVIRGAMTTGGTKNFSTTTVDTTITFSFNDLNRYTYWDIINETDTSNLTFTMPATSTMLALLSDIGGQRTWYFHNATTGGDATIDFTLVAGAGMEFTSASSTADVIAAESWMIVTCMQKAYIGAINENIVCDLVETVAAD